MEELRYVDAVIKTEDTALEEKMWVINWIVSDLEAVRNGGGWGE